MPYGFAPAWPNWYAPTWACFPIGIHAVASLGYWIVHTVRRTFLPQRYLKDLQWAYDQGYNRGYEEGRASVLIDRLSPPPLGPVTSSTGSYSTVVSWPPNAQP